MVPAQRLDGVRASDAPALMRLVGLELGVVVAQKAEAVPGKGAPSLGVILRHPRAPGRRRGRRSA